MSATTDHQGSSVMSLRGNQVHSVVEGSSLELELETFQRQVTLRFLELAAAGNDDLLSLSWIRKLLDFFILCQDELRMIFFHHRAQVMKPPMDRIVSDFFERCVKALDLCNAIRDGIEQIKQWQRLLEIVLCALDQKNIIGEGQCRRAKKALSDLTNCMVDDKESSAYMALRNRSFGRNTTIKDNYQSLNHNNNYQHRSVGHFRSLSWSVSRNWSAAKQLQAIGNSLCPPKSNDLVATCGLAMPVYTMSSVLLFVMWALVAAIPCQDRRLSLHILIPRQFPWSAPLLSLHERIMEDSKKRERKNACGLLREIQGIEKCVRGMNELVDTLQFPLTEEKREVVRQRVQDLSHVLEALKDGLDPLERQVREVFHVIVRGRVGT